MSQKKPKISIKKIILYVLIAAVAGILIWQVYENHQSNIHYFDPPIPNQQNIESIM
jgi:Na+-translocating ferredoxin:NAD+ oxidoreductase RnfG subunit